MPYYQDLAQIFWYKIFSSQELLKFSLIHEALTKYCKYNNPVINGPILTYLLNGVSKLTG